MIKVGVIGCGKIAERHLAAFNKLEGLSVTVGDWNPKLQSVADAYGVKWSNDISQMILDSDAVDILTPTPSHHEYLIEALSNHKHVFVEKPMTATLEQAQLVLKHLVEADTVGMVGHPYRFHPAYQHAKARLRDKTIGDPYMAILRIGGRGGHKAWKHKSETGGGAINEMLVHMIDTAQWLFGGSEPEVLDHYSALLRPKRIVEGAEIEVDAEDFVTMRLKYRDVVVLCEADLVTPGFMDYVEIQGTKGSLFTSTVLPSRLFVDGIVHEKSFPKIDWFQGELGYWLSCIRQGFNPGTNTIEETVKVMEVLENVR